MQPLSPGSESRLCWHNVPVVGPSSSHVLHPEGPAEVGLGAAQEEEGAAVCLVQALNEVLPLAGWVESLKRISRKFKKK